MVSKIFGLYPVIGRFRAERKERWYYTLMMSTGLTFGTISALYGLSHGIVTREQYSFLVAVVIASAVMPTLIAGADLPARHLLEVNVDEEEEIGNGELIGAIRCALRCGNDSAINSGYVPAGCNLQKERTPAGIHRRRNTAAAMAEYRHRDGGVPPPGWRSTATGMSD